MKIKLSNQRTMLISREQALSFYQIATKKQVLVTTPVFKALRR